MRVKRLMHASLKQGHEVRACGRAIRKLKPFICTVTEMDVGDRDFKAQLQKGLGRKYLVLSQDRGGRSEENMIIFRKSRLYRVESVRHTRFSPDGGDPHGWDNERGAQVLRFRRKALRKSKRKRYGAVGTHWDAVIQNKDGYLIQGPRATRVAISQSPGTEDILDELLDEGRAVSCGMDGNWRVPSSAKARTAEPKWTPGYMFARMHMAIRNYRVDWLAFGGGWVPQSHVYVVKPGEQGNKADHPWLYIDVKDSR